MIKKYYKIYKDLKIIMEFQYESYESPSLEAQYPLQPPYHHCQYWALLGLHQYPNFHYFQ